MVRSTITKKELFAYLDLPRIKKGEPVANTIAMTVEFMKYQGEVAYEIGKKQAMAITSASSVIGVGWSAFFFGIIQESWLTSGVGVMMAVGAMFLLGYWTPKVLDRTRKTLDDLGATKFYNKWLSESTKSKVDEMRP
jgi:hypothetical protein